MKSIRVTLKLLEALAEENSGLSVLEIARKLSFSKSTTHRTLQILEQEGFAEQDPTDQRYRRGPRMFNLAFNLSASFDLRNLAHPILKRIVEQVNETVYLCVYSQKLLVFLDQVQCSHPVQYINPIGRRQGMHAGAAGKVILAHLPQGIANQILSGRLPRFTPTTITDPRHLRKELKQIKEQGYAISFGEFAAGGVGMAAVILDSRSVAVGCINMVIPEDRFRKKKLRVYINLVRHGAGELSERLMKSKIVNPMIL